MPALPVPTLTNEASSDNRKDVATLKEEKWKHVGDIATSLATLAALIALLISIRALNRGKVYNDLSFLSEVDKMLIEHPELKQFYDHEKKVENMKITPASGEVTVSYLNKENKITEEKIKDVSDFDSSKIKSISGNAIIQIDKKETGHSTPSEKENTDQKIHGFIYYKLNNFEIALERHHDLQSEEAWVKYMVHSMLLSTAFRNVVQKESEDIIYSKNFKKKLKDLLAIVSEIHQNKLQPGHLSKEKYSESYLSELKNYTSAIEPIIDKHRKKMFYKQAWYKWIWRWGAIWYYMNIKV